MVKIGGALRRCKTYPLRQPDVCQQIPLKKPDVKLTYWQLSSDGRVAGIQGDVDINVFNGYQNQFDSFLEEETIK